MPKKKGTPGNLAPVQTKDEARERGRNGGIKSGEARRAKKELRELARMFLEMKPVPTVAQNLTFLGVPESDQTNMMALLGALYTEAMKGNVNAFRTFMEYAGMTPNQELIDLRMQNEMRAIEIQASESDELNEISGEDDVLIYLPDNGRGDANGSQKP